MDDAAPRWHRRDRPPLDQGRNVTSGYYRNPEANAAAVGADGWVRTGDLALMHEGEYYITGRSKEIIFVNGQNYYPHDLEAVLQKEPGLELGKVVAAGRTPTRRSDRRAGVFILHRGGMAEFLPLATRAAAGQRACGCRGGARRPGPARAEDDQRQDCSAPRWPKPTSQGEFAPRSRSSTSPAQRRTRPRPRRRRGIEQTLKAIVDDVLPGKAVDVDDNLFDDRRKLARS